MMNLHTQSIAWRLRNAIETGSSASFEFADLVMVLGGSTHVLAQNADKPHIVSAYLVALLLTQPQEA